MIEIYSKFYFLQRPITGTISSVENRRFKDGSTLLACTFDASSKQPNIRVANHIRFLSQNSKQKRIYQFFSKNSF